MGPLKLQALFKAIEASIEMNRKCAQLNLSVDR